MKTFIRKKWWLIIIVIAVIGNLLPKNEQDALKKTSSDASFMCPICGKKVQDVAYMVSFGQIQAVDLSNRNPENYPMRILSSEECYECALNIVNLTR